ncbi:YiiX/YebB-like N1pC/P60 family cysteine hydrolase [Luteolibacter arcticus]|uniref:YiiX/YebB-like N1pC/P60 family cysteine hydrolase n=1 Tax=Luteolibacter arcticus TaxID=1581411 RepID=A0ABT3GMR9_9BACT|nr:YiiX/YebB-like N1pC/P60 family cysteine hydrolase [Luteolibacter arcticus]MCW1924798.1 YiiX/YebB-like N1pC/P60 family cysteine hydrolase [Luteolibacter arcticus]
MLRLLTVLTLALSSCSSAGKSKKGGAAYQPEEGDILFQSLPNPMGMDLVDAIEGSTHSPYSHCGMVFQEGGKWKVIEAIGPVKITPLESYIERGRGKKVWAYRLAEKKRKHVPAALAAMRKDIGKPYDPRYRFDDQAIYCTELIWRGWKAATGEELGTAVTLGSLDWRPYQPVIEAIEGRGNLPLEREMITPRDMAKAKELTQVFPVEE